MFYFIFFLRKVARDKRKVEYNTFLAFITPYYK